MTAKTLHTVAAILGVPEHYLIDLAKRSNKCYRPFKQKRIYKDGTVKERSIDNPNDELKKVQKQIYQKLLLNKVEDLPPYMHGARAGKSIYTNACCHVRSEAILSLDLRNCFPNITYSMVYKLFTAQFNCTPQAAHVLAKLSTYNKHLPQGSPSSSALCNLILLPTLDELKTITDRANLNFSQFIDDLFMSGKLKNIERIQKDIIRVLEQNGWKINKQKQKVQTNNGSMQVAGVIVNQKTSAGRHRIRRIERDILKTDVWAYSIKHGKNGKRYAIYEYQKIQGKIANVSLINPVQGKKLQNKLDKKKITTRHKTATI